MVELLVVLVIVGALAMAAVVMVGDRPASAVRGVMDELEGTLAGAHQLAVSTGQDVIVATKGEWSNQSVRLAYGSATLLPATILANGEIQAETFKATGSREHMSAAAVTKAKNAWWDTTATGNEAITDVPPFNDKDNTAFNSILTKDDLNLFQGGTTTNSVRISGTNKRFTTTFWIKVVGLRNGSPMALGPMGLLVVQANGGTIYKFYNPGKLSGNDGKWRRI